MARGVFTTANHLMLNALHVGAGEFTFAGWIKPTTASVYAHIWGMTSAGGTNYFLRLVHNASGQLQCQWRSGGTAKTATTAAALTLGAWNFAAFKFKTHAMLTGLLVARCNDSEAAYSGTTSAWPTNLDTTSLGARYDSKAIDQPFNGLIGPWGLWSSWLDASYIDALRGGLDPRCVNPAALVSYYEMDGTAGAVDLIGATNYSEIGALPESSDRPALRSRGLRPWEFGFAGMPI